MIKLCNAQGNQTSANKKIIYKLQTIIANGQMFQPRSTRACKIWRDPPRTKKLQQTRHAGAYACEQKNNGTLTTSVQVNITTCISIQAAIVSSSTEKQHLDPCKSQLFREKERTGSASYVFIVES